VCCAHEADHEDRRRQTADAMERGREIYYLGHYAVRDQPDEPDATIPQVDGRSQAGTITRGSLPPEDW
jgi:hypothetical protein